jgi:precorrin-4/cobalt-precorrin-4 C11-methyltransferase
VIRCRLEELAARIRKAKIHKTALVLVGHALAASGTRSHLYHPDFAHEFRYRKREAAGGRA